MRRASYKSINVRIDKRSKRSLPEQIYESIQRLVLEKKLAPGAEIPSSRVLCELLGVARASVVTAYDALKNDGFIETRVGGKTWVCRTLPQQESVQHSRKKKQSSTELSNYSRRLLAGTPPAGPRPEKAAELTFSYWQCASHPDPLRLLTPYFNRSSRSAHGSLLDYPRDPLGYKPLRESIARSLRKTHGIKCDAGDVLIVLGLPQAIHLIARLHIAKGDYALLEEPGYPPLRKAIELEGGQPLSIAVDSGGLRTSNLHAHADKKISVAYVTPSHQFPTGVRMELARRLELLTWAGSSGAVVVEDEHDGAFNYTSDLVPSLKALDREDTVIFVGSFNKILFPSLAVAYLILPPSLQELYARAREQMSDQPPLIIQSALAECMTDGGLPRHVRKMRAVYQERRDLLVHSLRSVFGEGVDICGEQAGLHLLARFQSTLMNDEILLRARELGLSITATDIFYAGLPPQHEFILGFANLEPHEIEEAVQRLARALS